MLTTRVRRQELMDDPQLAKKPHVAALRGLHRVNWISRTVDRLWKNIAPYAHPKYGLRVLDAGSGGGDVLCGLARRAIQSGLPFQGVGCDISETACEHARRLAQRNLPKSLHESIQFLKSDCLQDDLPGDCDVAYCSLFLHHLDESEAIHLLKKLKSLAQGGVLVDDLVRSVPGYALAWVGTRLLSGSRIVHIDGPLSVRAAFTKPEVLKLAAMAEMDSTECTLHWPYRFLLHWRRV